jgi:hypothetical protein
VRVSFDQFSGDCRLVDVRISPRPAPAPTQVPPRSIARAPTEGIFVAQFEQGEIGPELFPPRAARPLGVAHGLDNA